MNVIINEIKITVDDYITDVGNEFFSDLWSKVNNIIINNEE